MALRTARSEPDRQTVLDALDDTTCQAILEALDGPSTAQEIADDADIPLSTTYRKLELLMDASLLTSDLELAVAGHHRQQYRIDFESVTVRLDETRTLTVEIREPPATPGEQFAVLWEEVRKEA